MSKGNHSSKTTKGLKGRKNHGPKRNLFSDYGAMTWKFGKLGLLDKYHDFDSFKLAALS